MIIDRAVERVLERLGDGQVEALARACAARVSPSAAIEQTVAGSKPATREAVRELASDWARAEGLTGAGLALALRTGLAARRRADERRARPVWTGPGAAGEQRLTATVLRDLVCSASERVLVVSFAAFTLPDVAADLTAAVKRGCVVDVVFETEDDSGGGFSGPQAAPFGAIEGVRRWRWPAAQRTPGALLHAKLLVADGCRALVGSANLTHRALAANLEAGVLIEDPGVAAGLEAHVRRLMRDGVLVQG